MKRALTTGVFLILSLVLMAGPVWAAQIGFEANGQAYTPYPEPVTVDGTLLVPVSAVADMLDIEAKCNIKEQTITFDLSENEMILFPGQKKAVVNGKETTLAVAPVVRDYRTFVPLKAVCAALGAQLSWDQSRKLIKITAPEDTNVLTIFHAGSLSNPLKDLSVQFKAAHPKVRIVRESAGSVECIRKVTEQGRKADLVISADYYLFDQMMIPQYADWYGMFATNEMVLCYRPGAPQSENITADNWYQILTTPGVNYAHTDPNLDPAGYRALMVWQLAEKYYGVSGLYQKLEQGCPQDKVFASAAELVSALQAGKVDYAFEYLSVAKQNGFSYLQLPAKINLADPALKEDYQQAKVTTAGTDGTTSEQVGLPIVNAFTIPNNALRPDLAVEFAQLLLGSAGQGIIQTAGQTPVAPALFSDSAKAPEELTAIK